MLTTIYTTLQSNKYITYPLCSKQVNLHKQLHKSKQPQLETTATTYHDKQPQSSLQNSQPIGSNVTPTRTHTSTNQLIAKRRATYPKKQLESNPSTNQQIKATQASPNHKFLNKTPKQVSQKYHNITQPTGAPTFKVKSRLIQSVTNHLHSVPTTNYQHTNPTANSHNHNTHRNNKTHRVS
eukprot:gene2730-1715_t